MNTATATSLCAAADLPRRASPCASGPVPGTEAEEPVLLLGAVPVLVPVNRLAALLRRLCTATACFFSGVSVASIGHLII